MLAGLKLELEKLAAAQRVREFHAVRFKDGATIEIKGKKLVDFSDWDFLGIRNSQRLKEVAHAGIERCAMSAASPRLCAGTDFSHLSAEKRIAGFLGAESSLLFASKNQAVLSLITSLVREGDLVIFDETLQSPVADACYLVNAESCALRAADGASVERELSKAGELKRKFVFVEAVSPLSGKKCDLAVLSAIAIRQRANLVVDESYALAAIGARGAGGLEVFRNEPGVDVFCEYADLSLGLGAFGAAVAGPAILISALINRSRTFAVETPLPPAIAAAIEAAIDIAELQPIARERIVSLAAKFRRGLAALGKFAGDDAATPIVLIPFSRLSKAMELSEALFQRGFFVEALSMRQSLSERAVVRAVVNAAHNEKHIDDVLQSISDVLERIEPAAER